MFAGPTQGCGGVLNTTSGVISSLDHTGNGRYEPGLGCSWQIIVPQNHNVRLRFDRFDLAPQGGDACSNSFDYLEVSSSTVLLLKTCNMLQLIRAIKRAHTQGKCK